MRLVDIKCAVRQARTKAECRILMRVNSLTWRNNRNGPCKGQAGLAWAKFFRDRSHKADGGAQ